MATEATSPLRSFARRPAFDLRAPARAVTPAFPRGNNSTGVRLARPLSVLLLAAMLGCSDRLPTYPVHGKVQFAEGGAVHVGTVELKSREHGIQARGQITADGSFELTTYEPGDGAVAGVHDCVVVQFVMTEGITGHRPSTLGVVSPRYNNYDTSGLTVQIEPEAPNQVVLEVQGIRKNRPSDAESHKH